MEPEMDETGAPGGAGGGAPTGAETPEKSNEVGGVVEALKAAAAGFRVSERLHAAAAAGVRANYGRMGYSGSTGEMRELEPLLKEEASSRVLAEQCEEALRGLEEMSALRPAPRAAVDLWAARAEALRFGWDAARVAAEYERAPDEWTGPGAPPQTLEDVVAAFRSLLARRG